MQKALLSLIIAGLGLSVGGVVFLFVEDFDILSVEPWIVSFELVKADPMALVREALGGQNRKLVGGFLAIYLGGLTVAASATVGALAVLISAVGHALKAMTRKKTARPTERVHEVSEREARWSLKKVFARRREDAFEDAVLDDEAGPRSVRPGVSERLRTIVSTLKGIGGSARDEIVVWSGGEKSVIGKMTDLSDFVDDLKDWNDRVAQANPGDPMLTAKAGELLERATPKALEMVRESDPEDGETMIRMMRAWAQPNGGQDADGDDEIVEDVVLDDSDARVMATAMKDVIEHGVIGSEDDEEPLDLEEGPDPFLPQVMLEGDDPEEEMPGETEGQPDDDEEAAEPFLPQLEGGDDDAPEADAGEEEEAGSDTQDGMHEVGPDTAIVQRAFEFRGVVKGVVDDGLEWPEEYAETAVRAQHVQSLFSGLHDLKEVVGESGLEDLCRNHEGEAPWEWIDRIRDDLDAEKAAIMDMILDPDDGSQDDEDEEDLGDFGMTFGSAAKDEDGGDGEAPSILSEADEKELEPEGGAAAPELETQEDTSPWEEGAGDDPATDDGGNDEADTDDAEAETLQSIDFSFDGEEDDEPKVEEVATPEEEKDEEHVPTDVSVDQLDEVERAGDVLVQWGFFAKNAGASEAKIVHTILEKTGVTRRVAGVVQMVANWKNDTGEQKRLYIIFRYVPEGHWDIELEPELRVVEQMTGDFVPVKKSLLEQEELRKGVTVVHFHGPGISGKNINEEIPNGLVVSRVLSQHEIKDLVGI